MLITFTYIVEDDCDESGTIDDCPEPEIILGARRTHCSKKGMGVKKN